MKLQSGSAKKGEMEFREMSYAEAVKLEYGFVVYCKGQRGYIRVKINGKPKTWKTRPTDLQIPIKYGLYEYAYAVMKDGKWVECALLVDEQGTINR